jgi:hypothetical protein
VILGTNHMAKFASRWAQQYRAATSGELIKVACGMGRHHPSCKAQPLTSWRTRMSGM